MGRKPCPVVLTAQQHNFQHTTRWLQHTTHQRSIQYIFQKSQCRVHNTQRITYNTLHIIYSARHIVYNTTCRLHKLCKDWVCTSAQKHLLPPAMEVNFVPRPIGKCQVFAKFYKNNIPSFEAVETRLSKNKFIGKHSLTSLFFFSAANLSFRCCSASISCWRFCCNDIITVRLTHSSQHSMRSYKLSQYKFLIQTKPSFHYRSHVMQVYFYRICAVHEVKWPLSYFIVFGHPWRNSCSMWFQTACASAKEHLILRAKPFLTLVRWMCLSSHLQTIKMI